MYVFQALILQERKMVHSKNSFLLGRLVSFHCCWFKKKKKGWEYRDDLFITLARAGSSLPLPSRVFCPPTPRNCSLCPEQFPFLLPGALWFLWPVLRGLKSNVRTPYFLSPHMWLPSIQCRGGLDIPSTSSMLRWFCRKEQSLSFEDVLVLKSLCDIGAHDKFSWAKGPSKHIFPKAYLCDAVRPARLILK